MFAEIVISVLLGVVAGAILGYFILRRLVPKWAQRLLTAWKVAEQDRIRGESLARSEAVLRGRVTEQVAPLLPDFGFDPADARFLGTPVDFIVFDGLREVRQGLSSQLREIVFVDIKTGDAALTTIQRRIRAALIDQNVWCHGLAELP